MIVRFGHQYANLFEGFKEKQFLEEFDGTKPKPYRCYIDDCSDATSYTRQDLDYLIFSLCSFYPALLNLGGL